MKKLLMLCTVFAMCGMQAMHMRPAYSVQRGDKTAISYGDEYVWVLDSYGRVLVKCSVAADREDKGHIRVIGLEWDDDPGFGGLGHLQIRFFRDPNPMVVGIDYGFGVTSFDLADYIGRPDMCMRVNGYDLLVIGNDVKITKTYRPGPGEDYGAEVSHVVRLPEHARATNFTVHDGVLQIDYQDGVSGRQFVQYCNVGEMFYRLETGQSWPPDQY